MIRVAVSGSALERCAPEFKLGQWGMMGGTHESLHQLVWRPQQAASRSHQGWLPRVLQTVEVYFSDTDVEIGSRWYPEIVDALEKSDAGLIILTPENISRQWIMFEAGAIARSVAEGRVCPILFGIKKSNLRGPLAFFQSVEFSEDDFRKLLKTINNGRLGEADFKDVFDTWWPKLKRSIEEITAAPQPAPKEPSTNELLQEILGLTRNLAIAQVNTQMLIQGLRPDPQVEAVVRALLRREAKSEPEDTATAKGKITWSGPLGSLTAKSE